MTRELATDVVLWGPVGRPPVFAQPWAPGNADEGTPGTRGGLISAKTA